MVNELLQKLKGARLSAFTALAFNEPELWLGRGKPLSVRDIAARTRLSPRHVLRAVQFLVEHEGLSAEEARQLREIARRGGPATKTNRADDPHQGETEDGRAQ